MLVDNILGYWNLNETSGAIIDSVASIEGTVSPIIVRPSDGIEGSGYYFPITGDSSKKANTGAFYNLTGDFGVSFWYKNNEPPYAFTNLIGNLNAAIDEGFAILFFDSGVIRVNVRSLYFVNTSTAYNLYDNNWHHIVATRSGTEIYIYVDGVLGTTSWISSDSLVSTTDFKIGSGGEAGNLYGYIDEVGIWDRYLTQTDVILLYSGGGGNIYPFSEPFLVKQIKFALVGGYWDDDNTWVDDDVWWED